MNSCRTKPRKRTPPFYDGKGIEIAVSIGGTEGAEGIAVYPKFGQGAPFTLAKVADMGENIINISFKGIPLKKTS